MRFFPVIFGIIFCFLSSLFASFFFITHTHWIDFSSLEKNSQGKPSIVLDDEGNEWARFSLDKREAVDSAYIPKHLVNAFIAAEDHSFFEHPGISWKGIVRSLFVNLYHGKIVQGASTITQQLAKLLFTDSRRTMVRKIKDQFFAVLVEQQFTKEHILQLYLNNICFGCGIFGVEAASQRFWSKKVKDLSIDEAALLAGIVKNPSHYCPLLYPLSAQKRRNIVLQSMKNLHFLTDEEFEQYKSIPVKVSSLPVTSCAPHLKEMIRIFLEEKLGKKTLYTGGLTIQTTINKRIQEEAEKIFFQQITELRTSQLPDVDGGLITIEGKTGQIKALVGGFDFSQSQFNRAIQAKRQIGSTFKPIVYAAAIQQGNIFAQTEIDEPIKMDLPNGTCWQPQNHIRTFEGEMTLARALSHSNNIIAIKLLMKVGIEYIIELAKKFGITDTMPPYPALALGCVDSPLKDVVAMFNVFAQHGMYVEPYYIRWVKNEWGTKIINNKSHAIRVISSRVSGQVAKVLSLGMERARKRFGNEQWIACDAIGKTGTTNDSRTCSFVGATPEYTTACYMGIDNNRSLGKNIFAVRTAFPLWRNVHRILPITKKHFSFDPSLKEIIIHARTGLPCEKHDPQAITIFR